MTMSFFFENLPVQIEIAVCQTQRRLELREEHLAGGNQKGTDYQPSPSVYDRIQVLNIRDSCFRPCHERKLSLYTRKRPSAT